MVYVDRFPEPKPGTAVFTRGYHETVGSSGAGKALNMRCLGADSTLWALVGEDNHAARIRDYMQGRGITVLTGVDPAGAERHVNLMGPDGERIYRCSPMPDPTTFESTSSWCYRRCGKRTSFQ